MDNRLTEEKYQKWIIDNCPEGEDYEYFIDVMAGIGIMFVEKFSNGSKFNLKDVLRAQRLTSIT